MIIAISMVKNEADILPHTLHHLLTQNVDKCVVMNNLSTDRTAQILEEYAPWCETIYDNQYGYYQSEKMSRLARYAYELGASWVLPFDADEMIFHPDLRIDEFLNSLPETVNIVTIQGWDYLPRPDQPTDGNPYEQFVWRRIDPQPYPKIMFRAHPDPHIHMGNHGVDHIPGETVGGLQLRHIQYRSFEQMCRKLRNGKAVYDATDLDSGQGTHWREGGALPTSEIQARWEALTAETAIYDPLR